MAHLAPAARIALILAILLGGMLCAHAGVVINEVLYDPPDTDTGHEWIELCNPGETSVNLTGWRILKGGEEWAEVFVFPSFMLRSHAFVLVGETQVEAAQFVSNLAFQNGGGETDGIRLESGDGLYTDTVLYDSPNTYALPDDSGAAGTSFATDVAQGQSLARLADGLDSDACADDFRAEAYPNPGAPNTVSTDYALLWPSIQTIDGDLHLEVYVGNLSTLDQPLSVFLNSYLDGSAFHHCVIGGITAGDSLCVDIPLPIHDSQNHLVELYLTLPGDPDSTNNYLSQSVLQQQLQPPVINEVMYNPASGYQEWIELWVESAPSRAGYSIIDAAGNSFAFSLPALPGYYVLCRYPTELEAQYPDCPPAAVIGVSTWASLNNTGDSLILRDEELNPIHTMSYAEGATPQGISLERYPTGTGGWGWRQSIASEGATPGTLNSSPSTQPPEHNAPVAVFGSPCYPREGQSISISYRLQASSNSVDCVVYSRSGSRVRVLARNLLCGAAGVLVWDGKDDSGRYVPRGLYHILWESTPTQEGKLLSRKFTAVIGD